MPLGEWDMNASGRASRASNMSTASRGSKGPGPASDTDLAFTAPGVASMLRNSTEMGNLGGLTMPDSFGVPNGPRGTRRGATSRLSTASSHSNHSNRMSVHRAWPSQASNATRRSRENNVPQHMEDNMPQYLPDTLSPTTVNISGSSPLIPVRVRDPRDSHRSRSMTMANESEPTFRLSANRSLVSLRSNEQNAYRYPTRLRRPGFRPNSPALSDSASAYAQRGHGHGSQSVPPHPGAARRRMPSDVSIRRDERRTLNAGPPDRSRTPVYFGDPHPDIPPVPPLVPHRYHAVEPISKSQKSYRSASYRSGKASVSSGSTSRRTDSDAPSSDATSPPTPKDGLSMDGFSSPTGTQPLMRSISGVMKNGVTSRPEYYDYTEHFETEQFIEPEANAVPTGYVHRMKGILEERGTPEPITKKVDAFEEVAGSVTTVGPDVVELPASPVPRRLTKDLVRSVLGCATPTDGIESYGASTEAKSCHEASSNDEEPSVDDAKEDRAISCLQPPEVSSNRYSILSQAGSSIMNSSTLEFAVRYSIPMVAGNGITMATDDTGDAAGPAAEPTTEDGMSDLLDGYQHTDTKQEIEAAVEEDIVADDRAEKTSNHAAKSSNEQSFKSCTDLPELTEHSVKGMDVKSCEDLPQPEPPFKDSDAKSFKTCKDAVTPERIVSMLDSKLPLSRLAASEPKFNRPTSEMPCSSPLSPDDKLPPPSASESSMTRLSNRFRTNSKPGSKHGSAAASVSSSIGSGLIQPPPVPPRESSSSKEAQRSSAVAGFLMRQIRPRLAKATSSLSRKPAKKEARQEEEITSQNIPTPPPMRERPLSNNANSPIEQFSESVEVPELVSIKQEPALTKKNEHSNLPGDSWTSAERTPLQFPALKSTPIVQLRPSGTPSPMLAEPSSVYSPAVSSPENNSFSTSHVQPSPVTFLPSPEGNCRDSQTTTHLSWPGQKPLVLRSVNGGEECMAQGTSLDETTTTDLRPATYQKYPTNYLPDLKEESHEDSSLNTSASNLKHSSFRFPGAGQPDLRVSRMSIDDAAVYGRSPSTKSYRKSGLAKTCGLPSMNFSVMNLADKFGDIFEHRGSRSLELSLPMREELLQLDLHRPVSAGGVPAKYQSGLADLDTSNGMAPALSDMFLKKRSFSPQALKDEVDNLNVPSVDALTLRFSELMPSLREDFQEDCRPGSTGEFVEEEKIMEHALEEIKEVSKPAPKQSIARLRAVPGSSSVVVVYDDLFKEQQQEKRDDGPKSAKELGEIGATKGRSWSVAHTRARDKTVLAELEAPSPTAVRSRSLSLGHQELCLSSDSRLSSRSVRSLESTPTETVTDTRPWNRDENYPWATTESVEIDISLPRSAAARSSPRPGPSNLRHRLSKASSASGTSGPDGTPGSPTSPGGTMPMPGSDDPYTHARRQSIQRWSLFGMPSKQAVNSPAGIDASGFATGPVRVRDEDQSHGAESTSRFSNYTTDDDAAPSSSRKGRLVKKKGRNKKAAVNRAKSSRVQEISQSASTNESTSSEGGTTEVQPRENRRTFSGAEGMSRWTYYSSKFVDKVRGLYDSVRRLGRRSRKSNDGGAQAALTPF